MSNSKPKEQYISERTDLFYFKYLNRTVFVNCAGFLKIDGYCPLDRTRIHVENKALAQKISSDALEEDELRPDLKSDKYDSITKIMQKP